MLVEHVLKMLEGQSKLQDSGVDVGSLGQLSGKGGDDTGEGHGGGDDAVVQQLRWFVWECCSINMEMSFVGHST